MDLFSPNFWTALVSIIIIDLVLAGDNAVVIGMSARNLPKKHQKAAIVWGTAGAIIVRVLMTLAVLWLLKIPGLMLVGGILLVWISYKLLVQKKSHENVAASSSLRTAIVTIVVADTIMGIDNVLAIAGASHGNFLIVILGLLISIPIMVFGSTLVIKLIDRYPVIIYIGAGVLAYTAGSMITDEPMLHSFFDQMPAVKWLVIIAIVAVVIIIGRMKNAKQTEQAEPKKAAT